VRYLIAPRLRRKAFSPVFMRVSAWSRCIRCDYVRFLSREKTRLARISCDYLEQKRLFGVRRVIWRQIAANFAAEKIFLKGRD
jgi:hypothetical protein